LRATALLSSGSFVCILAGVVSAKALAVLVGPDGVGMNGLLFSITALGAMFVGLGLSTGLVRLGAEAASAGDEAAVAALYRAAWRLFWLLGGPGLALAITLREPIAQLMLGSADYAGDVVLMAVAAGFTLAAGIRTGLINAHHRVSALARLTVVHILLATTSTVLIVGAIGAVGIAWAILAGSVLNWALAGAWLRRELPAMATPRDPIAERAALGKLVAFGVPFTGSLVVGSGVGYMLPLLVLHDLGPAAVGLYRAATAILERQIGLLTNAFVFDYGPRLMSERDPARIAAMVDSQLRMVLLIAVPVVLALLAVAPVLLPLLYTAEFAPGVGLLQGLLLGALFKLPAWAIGTAVMMHCETRVYFLLELVGGASLLALSAAALGLFGLPGLGVAYALASALYLLVSVLMLRARLGYRTSRGNRQRLATSVLVATGLLVVPLSTEGGIVLGLTFALAAAAYSFTRLRHDLARERFAADEATRSA
jgi:PST family polysaccharide transporter